MNNVFKGIAINIFDTDLNFKEKIVIKWPEGSQGGYCDLVLAPSGFRLIRAVGKNESKICVTEYKNGGLSADKILIPPDVLDTYQPAARPHTVFKNGRYYLAFNSKEGPGKHGPKELCVGIFDQDLNFLNLVRLNQDCAFQDLATKHSEYVGVMNNNFYAVTCWAKKNKEEWCEELSQKLTLNKH
jgi:hypothetical protein